MIIKKQSLKMERKAPLRIESAMEQEPAVVQAPVEQKKDVTAELFNVDNISFSQRQERRRGDRRRGYRRIDDRNLISRAQEEADTIKETAAKEGYKAGLEQAKVDINMLKEALQDFVSAKKEVFEFIAPDILEISIDIARRIIKKEVEQDPEIVLNAILEVMNSLSKDETKLTIKVNPLQVDFIKSELPEKLNFLGVDAKINIISDEVIEEGGCVVLTANGIVDAGISTQMEILKEALKGI